MSTTKQIDANRQKAQRSTGPRSPAGKAAADRPSEAHPQPQSNQQPVTQIGFVPQSVVGQALPPANPAPTAADRPSEAHPQPQSNRQPVCQIGFVPQSVVGQALPPANPARYAADRPRRPTPNPNRINNLSAKLGSFRNPRWGRRFRLPIPPATPLIALGGPPPTPIESTTCLPNWVCSAIRGGAGASACQFHPGRSPATVRERPAAPPARRRVRRAPLAGASKRLRWRFPPTVRPKFPSP
jgi:hypothetical protein